MAVFLFASVLFCDFGFLTSFEQVGVAQVGWVSGYGLADPGELAGAVYYLVRSDVSGAQEKPR